MLKSIVQKNTSIKWCFYVFNAGTPPLREKVYSQIVTWESISILKGKTFTVFTRTFRPKGSACTLDCLIQALVRIAILLYLIPFKWCEYKTPCSPLKKHGANRRHGVLNRKKPILISLAWCTFFKNTGGNIKQNFDMLYQFQKKWCEYKA